MTQGKAVGAEGVLGALGYLFQQLDAVAERVGNVHALVAYNWYVGGGGRPDATPKDTLPWLPRNQRTQWLQADHSA